ncbi:MAG TPA: hypothetical protein VFO79_10295 [Xanthomonadales bacterium]|nr:hypothetical protein [Xanthomonadales bacterium]
MRIAFLPVLLLAATAPATGATTLAFQGAALLQFDSLYYPMSPGTLTIEGGTFSVGAPASMTNCRRESGLAQTVSSVRLLAGATTIYLDETATNGAPPPAELRMEFGMAVVRFRSRTGDVVCDGAVVPVALDTLYRDGFE